MPQSKLLPVVYPPSFFLQLLTHSHRLCLVVYHSSSPHKPVAFISGSIHGQSSGNSDTKIQILTLGVLPCHRNNGLARFLVQTLIHQLREGMNQSSSPVSVIVQVCTSNTPACRFYKGLGLEETHLVRDLYRTLPLGFRDAYIVKGTIY